MPVIELTDEQRQALQVDGGKPVDVVDPATQRRFVLLALEHYERVRSLLEQHVSATASEPRSQIAPMMLRSMEAYWRDRPEFLKLRSRKHQWVGYHGDERICLGRTDLDVYQECFRHGLQRGEFYVGKLEANPEGIPPWGTLDGDWSLYEVTEEDEGTRGPNVE